ncbi:MAG: thermonuclease family protein [Gloeotrichia echinulata DEX184]|nr:thermonuclease family protein [Gloeotrichia echinulata DEX184]
MKLVFRNFLTLGAIASVIGVAAILSPRTKSLVEAAADFTSPGTIPLSEYWEVVSVADGDTITVKRDGESKKIRFCGMDANESEQEGGQEAKAYLKKLLDQTEGRVMITPIETDRYKRTVAEVFISLKDGSEEFIQEEMVKAGMARAYPQYISSCPNKDAILKAEQIGKQNRVGIWANPNSIPPWEWRKQHRRN